jgi:hypothetical protein
MCIGTNLIDNKKGYNKPPNRPPPSDDEVGVEDDEDGSDDVDDDDDELPQGDGSSVIVPKPVSRLRTKLVNCDTTGVTIPPRDTTKFDNAVATLDGVVM